MVMLELDISCDYAYEREARVKVDIANDSV